MQRAVLGAARGIYGVFFSPFTHRHIYLLKKNWRFGNIIDLLALLWKEIEGKKK